MEVKIGDLVLFPKSTYNPEIIGVVLKVYDEVDHTGSKIIKKYIIDWFDAETSIEYSDETEYFRNSFLKKYGHLLNEKEK